MLHDIREIPERGDGAFPIVEVLAKDSGEFYQAGSRYMQCATKESDWDFYAEYEDKLVGRLLNHGFEPVESTYYFDVDENDESAHTAVIMGCGNVHVQVLYDVPLMRRVRDRIMQTRLQEHIEAEKGSARREIWNQTITTITKEMIDEVVNAPDLSVIAD